MKSILLICNVGLFSQPRSQGPLLLGLSGERGEDWGRVGEDPGNEVAFLLYL